MPDPAPLTYEQTTRLILSKLGDLEHPVVLIGGQAVGFWASFYQARVPTLAQSGPITSKDVDFCGDRDAILECAKRLGGTPRLSTFDDVTPMGTVTFVDDDGVARTVDFIANPAGLDYAEVIATSIPAAILDSDGHPTGTSFRVMHPVLSLASRAHNVARLPGYNTPHALRQLRASIPCAHAFLLDVLAEHRVQDVLALNERIFKLAAYGAGLEVFHAHAIDLFEAALVDPRLPEKFQSIRYP
jgi:hypothetical protein